MAEAVARLPTAPREHQCPALQNLLFQPERTLAGYNSSASESSRASSTLTPKYLIVLSSFVWPSKS